MPQDWFSTNAPKISAPASGEDWFSQNAAKVEHKHKEQPGFLSRAYDSSIGGIVEMGKQVLNKGIVKVADEMGTAAVKRFKDNPRNIGTRDQMLGGIESIPTRAVDAVFGPAVDVIEGDVRSGNLAGAAGGVVGNLAMAYGPKMIQKATTRNLPGSQTVASSLEASAAKQYGQVLNPTKQGTKYLSQKKVVPGLIDRGVVAGSMKGLKEKAAAQVESLGAKIGDYWEKMPDDAMAPVDDIVNRIRAESINQHTVAGPNGTRVPLGDVAETALKNSESLATTLDSVAVVDANGLKQIPVKKLREMRQYFDDIAARAKRYQGADLAEANRAEAYGKAADAIREEFSKADPSLAAINKEFSFWKDTEKVVDETILRREGQAKPLGRKLAEGAGAIAGATQGGIVGAVVGKYALSALETLTTSPAWRTLSAVTKDRLAKAIARGDAGSAKTYIDALKTEAKKAKAPVQSSAIAVQEMNQGQAGKRQ
jgi:hypothetical protein